MSKYWLLGGLSALLILGAGCSKASPASPVDNSKPLDAPPGIPAEEFNKPATLPAPAPAPEPALENKVEVEAKADVSVKTPGVKVVTVDGSNFAFAPAEIRVKKGVTVKVVFKSTDGFHDFSVDGYSVATSRVSSGGTASVEFVADKVGTFEYFCSVGSHRQMGMKGNLIVE